MQSGRLHAARSTRPIDHDVKIEKRHGILERYSPRTRCLCSSRISYAVLVRDSRTSRCYGDSQVSCGLQVDDHLKISRLGALQYLIKVRLRVKTPIEIDAVANKSSRFVMLVISYGVSSFFAAAASAISWPAVTSMACFAQPPRFGVSRRKGFVCLADIRCSAHFRMLVGAVRLDLRRSTARNLIPARSPRRRPCGSGVRGRSAASPAWRPVLADR
jgi:hypothetical protein